MRPLAVRTALILVAVWSSRLAAQGTGCRETTFPPTLPAPNALVDSAHAIADLAPFAAASKPMVFSVVFNAGDSIAHVRALDKNNAAAAVTLANYARRAPPRELWAFRVRIAGGDVPALTLERSMYCPPVASGGARFVITGTISQSGFPAPMPPDVAQTEVAADTLSVEALISGEGQVDLARVLRSSGNRATDARAVGNLKQLKFEPAKLDGQPIQAVFRSHGQSPRP